MRASVERKGENRGRQPSVTRVVLLTLATFAWPAKKKDRLLTSSLSNERFMKGQYDWYKIDKKVEVLMSKKVINDCVISWWHTLDMRIEKQQIPVPNLRVVTLIFNSATVF